MTEDREQFAVNYFLSFHHVFEFGPWAIMGVASDLAELNLITIAKTLDPKKVDWILTPKAKALIKLLPPKE